jgi:RNA polymerase sigma-70 factor, ECF subfamily
MEREDNEIVSDYLAGNDAAFSELVKKYLKSVYNFLYQLTSDHSSLDDLTQETFVKAWKNIKKFDPERSFKTWIFTIAKNTAYDYFKKKKTIPLSNFIDVEGNNKLENISEDEILPLEILEKADAAKEIEAGLAKISSQYRLILTMCYKDDLALQEIAEVLNLPYNTVKSQHQRALAAIKKQLNGNAPSSIN